MHQRLGSKWGGGQGIGRQHGRQRLVVRGEPRSANRSKWAGDPGASRDAVGEAVRDVEDIHQLVGAPGMFRKGQGGLD